LNDFQSACRAYRERAERALSSRLPGPDAAPARLGDAMRYACLGGGKRFRAMLVYACGETAGAAPGQLQAPAAAVEMMHAYSLIHDDLPAMDDDDLRRGRPACHIAFDEATAILAGDALQTLAFEVLSADPALGVRAARRLRMIEALAAAGGARGMAGGQALDMQATGAGQSPDVAHLARIHRLKTGALIRAAARLGGLAAERADDALLGQLDHYAANVGLAFQIADDILDVEAGPGGALGKRSGADQRMRKATYAGLLGVEKAKTEARNLCRNALETAASLGDNAAFLAHLARFAVNRSF